jgi:hypothetical protein
MSENLVGPGGRVYADPKPGKDEVKFREDNTSEAYYKSTFYLQNKNQVQRIPPRRNDLPLNLSDFLPPDIIAAIESAGKISFHAVGDTGAAKVNRSQTAATAIGHEAAVADAMVADVQNQGAIGPAFFFHLGDVIYNFGEAQYYYIITISSMSHSAPTIDRFSPSPATTTAWCSARDRARLRFRPSMHS